ncbi:uncharacterized protein DUF2507 [Scopulibacillus darangshiensis]|uniref:Uncharacterized protein DUF2507 n=1 Tax=Scopulibacillus darangshiensis TaxID=442528 RepID=A0A4R2PAZ3_9BACL|nr:YslB family protein [Scopulibacillus darangshiensis]TCP32137.1 uncharacterized protein DUF2507 [Scopulibacillus darangshiensis]
MTQTIVHPKAEHYGDLQTTAFGYELIRNALIPELLGEESASILYWSGRKIARQYPLDTTDAAVLFFEQAGWGTLELIEKTKNNMIFDLGSDIIQSRIKDNPDAVFTLEAGFLAEQIQQQTGYIAEVYTEIKTGKEKKVSFTVKWDHKDQPISNFFEQP